MVRFAFFVIFHETTDDARSVDARETVIPHCDTNFVSSPFSRAVFITRTKSIPARMR